MATISLRKKDKSASKISERVNPLSLIKKPDHANEKLVVCKECGHVITKPILAIDPAGKVYTNPMGINYHIVCYKDAFGARDIGTPTSEFSWFPDYAWSMAHCMKCYAHLGWWFVGPTRFIGLITANVVLTG